MGREGWWYHFKRSIQIYKTSKDKYIGSESNGNKYYERYFDGKHRRYVLNPHDLDIPGR